MSTPKSTTATILIATDIVGDAALVKDMLNKEFDHVFISTDPAHAVADFEQHRPDVLVLAFNELKKSEDYYLGLYRLCPNLHQHPHHSVILCGKDEVKQAYELCMKEYFDDYILFWPMTYDSSRLLMSVHNALRDLSSLIPGEPSATEFAQPQNPWTQKVKQEREPLLKSAIVPNAMAERIRPTVLVVDDDEFQRKIIGTILGAENYHLIFAGDGFEALNLLRKTRPDVILMDVMMPNMDGMETTRRLKAAPHSAKTPVIMVTGKSEGKVVVDSLKAGAVDFVVKPFDRATLIAKITRVLNTSTSPLPQ
jgi:CheY-like chemotaxis protein